MERPVTGADIEQIVRGLTAAAKALRLYPPTSPIPRQSVEAAASGLQARLAGEPVLSFKVSRDGLAFAGDTVAPGAPGGSDLAASLRDHGVAEVDFLPGVSVDELFAFLAAVRAKPEEVRDRGGLAAALQADGVEHVRTSAVSLTVIDSATADMMREDLDGFLRELATDPDKVSTWLGVAVKGDPGALAAGLTDLATAAGADNVGALLDSLAGAFVAQDADGKDAILGLALEQGSARQLLSKALARVPSRDLAGGLAFGAYGKNMLSMSTALSRLPLAERFGDVMAQVKDILPTLGHDTKQLDFLDHMIAVRTAPEPEQALADTQPVYRKVAEIAALDGAQIAGERDRVLASNEHADEAAVATLLRLLDQQEDLALYRRTLDSLSAMIPSLIERGRLPLAAHVLTEMNARESRGIQAWPELTEMLRAAIADATSARAMRALVGAVAEDPAAAAPAREIMQRAGEASQAAFVEAALSHKPDGLTIAEAIVGRRLNDMLSAAAPRVQWFQVAPLVAMLGREGEARPMAAVETLMRRPDEQSRREVANGLALAGGPLAVRHLSALLGDASLEVATAAARALAAVDAPGAAAALAGRLSHLEVDGKDYPLAREVIGALARSGDSAATDALSALAGRRALIKRGHFAEVTELARQALAQQSKGGGRP